MSKRLLKFSLILLVTGVIYNIYQGDFDTVFYILIALLGFKEELEEIFDD